MLRRISALALVMCVGGCSDDTGTTPGGDDPSADMAVVTGRIDQSSGGGGAAASSIEASTVAVAQVGAGGTLDVLAEADVGADGRFRVEDVPGGRSELVVVARLDGEETGRVLVHGETRAGHTTLVHPIDFESTLEARIFADARARGLPAGSSAEVSLLLRMDQSTAAEAVADETSVQVMTTAFVEAAQALSASLEASGGLQVDAAARSAIVLEAVQQHAIDMDSAVDADVAHRRLVQGAVDAFTANGLNARLLAEASAATASVLDASTVDLTSSVRADASLGATLLNLEARSRLAAEAGSENTAGTSDAVLSALASAQAGVSAGFDLSALTNLFAEIEAQVRASLMAAVNAATPGVTIAERTAIEAATMVALGTADLSTHLSGDVDATAVAQVMASYRPDLTTSVEALTTLMTAAGASVDSAAMVDVFIAAGANAAIR